MDKQLVRMIDKQAQIILIQVVVGK